MKTSIYLFEPLTLKRKDQTIHLEKMPGATHTHPGSAIAQELVEELDLSAEDAWWKSSPKYIPVERVDCIHAYDAVRINSAFLNFLSQKNIDRKSTRLNSSHVAISYAVFCLKKK